MIHEVKMFVGTCDNCKEDHKMGEPENDKEFLKGNMQHWGWHFTDRGLCYCPKCHFFDNEHTLIIMANRNVN